MSQMLFYFVRHGETNANSQQLLAGSGLDHELNEVGHDQARALGLRIASAIEHKLHRLIVSNMIRTQQTANYIVESIQLKPELHAGFREWNLGEWEGQRFEDYAHLLLGDGEPREGESRKDFYSRIENSWNEIHSNDQPYLIVSHGAVWLAMQDFLKIPRFRIDNCELIRLENTSGAWKASKI